MKKKAVGTGVAYLYIEAIAMMFSGYIYWFLLSKITTSSAIGTSSTVVSFVTIFMTISALGVPNGVQKFFGKSFAESEDGNLKSLIKASFILTSLGFGITSIMLIIFSDIIYRGFQFDFNILILSILIIGASTFSALLRSMIIPSLDVSIITISSVVSVGIKIIATVILVMIGYEVLGILIGILLYPLATLTFLSYNLKQKILSKSTINGIITTLQLNKDILKSSFGFWLPGIIATVGLQLGTILVFVSGGPAEAGIYFISFSIATGITLVLSVLSTIAYPTISSLTGEKKYAVWRLIKISLIVTIPFSVIIIIFAHEILSLFGPNYIQGTGILQILLISVFPSALIGGINVLCYSDGKNKLVLLIGLATSIPRVLLYIAFIPLWGATGASYAYTMGSIIGVFLSLVAVKKFDFNLHWKKILQIVIFPASISLLLSLTELNYILSIFITLVLTYLIYLKLDIISFEDIDDISYIVPFKVQKIAYPLYTTIINRIKNKNE